jgi:TMEM175 potassium channel family protein
MDEPAARPPLRLPLRESSVMHKGRLEAFTDGVIAVIITVMVLEMKAPPGTDFAALASTLPVFITYALSYTNVAIFWNNHHHMLQVSERVDGRVLWPNMFLLFWLSLVPFVIRWMDETDFAALPTATYGFVLVMAAIGYLLLERMLIAINGADSRLARAVGRDLKAKLSLSIYAVAIGLAFVQPWIALALYIAVALLWFVPDRRIEKII